MQRLYLHIDVVPLVPAVYVYYVHAKTYRYIRYPIHTLWLAIHEYFNM